MTAGGAGWFPFSVKVKGQSFSSQSASSRHGQGQPHASSQCREGVTYSRKMVRKGLEGLGIQTPKENPDDGPPPCPGLRAVPYKCIWTQKKAWRCWAAMAQFLQLRKGPSGLQLS